MSFCILGMVNDVTADDFTVTTDGFVVVVPSCQDSSASKVMCGFSHSSTLPTIPIASTCMSLSFASISFLLVFSLPNDFDINCCTSSFVDNNETLIDRILTVGRTAPSRRAPSTACRIPFRGLHFEEDTSSLLSSSSERVLCSMSRSKALDSSSAGLGGITSKSITGVRSQPINGFNGTANRKRLDSFTALHDGSISMYLPASS
mmetsp:Transcript_11074/g.15859  ORF Transcript_11074/g.15859 Transcript_11074/m.15859 type:complete len:204 (-) Transcript_11074:815-1426(-)